MNSELFFEGKKYISSKRASKLSRYNQDYIGQLIRDSKLIARRVGRSWFVSLESLEKHLGKVKGIDQTKNTSAQTSENFASEEHKPLFLEGKKYISSKEASDISGYSRDYIGQLVRKNAVDAKMVGRLWYVSSQSLEKHIQKQSGKGSEINISKPQIAEEKNAVSSNISKYQKEEAILLPKVAKKELIVHSPKKEKILEDSNFVYVLEPLPEQSAKVSYPTFSPKKTYSSFYHLKKTALVGFIAIVLIFGASVISFEFSSSGVSKNNPDVLASASVLSSSSLEGFALDWYRYVNGKFIGVQKFFASLFGTTQLAYAPLQQTKPVTQGMVVMPNTPTNQQTVEHIKNSFSDKVGVSQNPDGVSGVITPVFQKVSGDEYLYVLVPVKPNKQ